MDLLAVALAHSQRFGDRDDVNLFACPEELKEQLAFLLQEAIERGEPLTNEEAGERLGYDPVVPDDITL